jgi:hypothetical protein
MAEIIEFPQNHASGDRTPTAGRSYSEEGRIVTAAAQMRALLVAQAKSISALSNQMLAMSIEGQISPPEHQRLATLLEELTHNLLRNYAKLMTICSAEEEHRPPQTGETQSLPVTLGTGVETVCHHANG